MHAGNGHVLLVSHSRHVHPAEPNQRGNEPSSSCTVHSESLPSRSARPELCATSSLHTLASRRSARTRQTTLHTLRRPCACSIGTTHQKVRGPDIPSLTLPPLLLLCLLGLLSCSFVLSSLRCFLVCWCYSPGLFTLPPPCYFLVCLCSCQSSFTLPPLLPPRLPAPVAPRP